MPTAQSSPFRSDLPAAFGRHWRRARGRCCTWLAAALLLWPAAASAAQVSYTATHVGGTVWSYAYVVNNNAGAADILELTLYFDPVRYSNLGPGSAPAGWDPLLIQPDGAIPDDGFFDVLATGPGIGAGASLAGFSVQFDFAGAGAPGAQLFEIVDPGTFAVIDSGMTTALLPPGAVPEPSTLALAGLGLLAFAMRRRALMQ